MKKLLQIRNSILFIGIVFALIAFANNANGATTYTWNGSVSTDYQTASNWTATRTTPAANDILVFPSGTWNVTNVPTQTIATLTIQASAVVTLTPASTNTLTASGTSTMAAGGSLTINSSLTFNPATFTITGGTLINNGTMTSATININSSGSLTNNGSVTATTALASPTPSGTFTQGVGATLTLGNTTTVTTLNATASNNTVTYNRANTQTIKAATYYNLTLTSVGTADTKTAGGILTVKGTLTTSGGAPFAYGAFAHHFEGNWVINSTEAAPIVATAGSTINFDTPGTPAPTSIGGSTTATLPFINVNFNNTSGNSRAGSAPSAPAKNDRAHWFIWLLIVLIVSSGWLILSLSKNKQSPESELMEIRSLIEGKQLTQKQSQEKFDRMNEIFRNHPALLIKEKNEREREISARTVPMFITDLTVHLKASIQSPENSGHELYIPIMDAVVGTFDSEKVIQHMEINKELIIKKVAEKLVDANYESLVKINSTDYLKKIILDSIGETTGTSRFEDYPASRTESPGRYGVVDILFPNSFSVR